MKNICRFIAIDKNFIRKYSVYSIAMLIIAIAVLIILECRIGSDSVTVLIDGLHVSLALPFSRASALYNFLILIFGFIFSRRFIGLGSVLYPIHIVFFLTVLENVFPMFKITEKLFLFRVIIFIIGQALLSLGLSLLMSVNFGMNSLDALVSNLVIKLRIPYFWLRTFVDILLVVVGIFLGGVFGIGTILSVVFNGYLIEYFYHLFEPKLKLYINDT